MPELPEVETLRRGLAARITGMPITAIDTAIQEILRAAVSSGGTSFASAEMTARPESCREAASSHR